MDVGQHLPQPSPDLRELLRSAEQSLRAGDREKAITVLQRAQTLAAPDVERYAVGVALLRASNGRIGWDLYDLHPSRPVDRLPGVRRWAGERCEVLVLLAEQGFGDAIQFIRAAPLVGALAEKVVVAVHDELLGVVSSSPLLRGYTTMSRSAARQTNWTSETRWERLMSVPARTRGWAVSAAEPYLCVDATGVPQLPPAHEGCLTIGVAWRSTPRRGIPNRSFPARLLSQLVVPGRTKLLSLHRNRDVKGLPRGVEAAHVNNFIETASAISQCDYVVTADTVTAHLASALGVPTLICLRYWPDWRWGTPDYPTRWYASAELLFQDETENWAPVLSAAADRILGADRHPPAPRTKVGS